MKPVKHIRITDPYVIGQVERIRTESGEPTASKAAGRLIVERCTQVLERPQATTIGNQPIGTSDARNPNAAA
jgi:hypothetical protein